MVNQGMTNWKFSAFFAIALMLIAGVFSPTAMAEDGAGGMSVATPGTSPVRPGGTAADPDDARLTAGGTTTLTFTFNVEDSGDNANADDEDMAGGLVELRIPTGWTFDNNDNADTPARRLTLGGGNASEVTDLTPIADSVTKVVLRLDAGWNDGGTVTIGLPGIKVPIPDLLTDGDRSDRYEEYEFTTYSRTRSGKLRELSTRIRRDNTNTIVIVSKQPTVRVGNIASGTGTVKISPELHYETYSDEKARKFDIEFTATGPMWDSHIQITFPADLADLDAAQVQRLLTATGSLNPTGNSGEFRIGNIGSSEVSLSAVTGGGDADQLVTIDVTAMDKGQGFRITYYSAIPDVSNVNDNLKVSPFQVGTDTDRVAGSDNNSFTGTNVIPFGTDTSQDPSVPARSRDSVSETGRAKHGTAGFLTGGMLRQKDGSGTMTITKMYVQHDPASPLEEFTLTYKAATYLQNAVLTITVPEELLGHDGADAGELPDLPLQPITLLKGGSDSRKSREAGYVYTPDRYAKPDAANAPELTVTGATANANLTPANSIRWHELDLNAGQTFRTKIYVNTEGTAHNTATGAAATPAVPAGDIRDDDDEVDANNAGRDEPNDGVYPFYTSLDALSSPSNGDALEGENDADLYGVRSKSVDVTFMVDPDGNPTTTTGANADTDHVTYTAASTQTITFRFKAVNTSIKKGSVLFRMPTAAGWTTPAIPNDKSTNAGRLTAKMYKNAADLAAGTSTAIAKGDITAGRQVTVKVDALAKGGAIDIVYTAGKVQYTADEVDIIGEFKASPNDSSAQRAGRIEVTVTNVADGSGSATMSTGTAIRAGSTDNTITVTFKAPGTMSGGQVGFELPNSDWGAMQEDDDDEPNYMHVKAGNGGTLDASNPAYVGREVVIANLENFEKGDTVTFTYGYGSGDKSGAEAPSEIGVDAFVISSAGSRSGSLVELAGDAKQPPDKDEDELLGKIYWVEAGGDKDAFDRGTDTANGKLRVNVVSAADGTGEATVEIRNSSSPTGKYGIDADGDPDKDAVTQQVHAGDTDIYLLFTYTPHETITTGELRFTVPTGWTIPQEDDQGKPGYTYFEEVRNADIGSPVISGTSRTITVEIDSMTKDDAIQIHYGWHGVRDGGAEAPADARPDDEFEFQIRGSEKGSPDRIRAGNPEVKVWEAASGSGEVDIDPKTAAAADMETVTITYTAAGEIKDGTLRLEVPDKWSDASSDNITVSVGSADHGRQYYETEDDDGDGTKYEALDNKPKDVANIRNVLVRDIKLAAGGTVVFTYNTQVGATIGDHKFKLEFKGGEGPGLDDKDASKGFGAVSGNLTVKVGEAAAGTGTPTVTHAPIQAGDTDTDAVITFIYTAAGEIDYPGTFAVRVPTEWGGAPSAASYEVEYQDKDGNALSGTSQSVERASPDGRDMMAKIRGASSPRISAEHRIVFTYTSAAPATAGSYNFTMFYDDVAIDDPLEVLVLSAADASVVKVSVTDKLTDAGDEIPVTVNLYADDGETAATRKTSLTVTLSSDATGGMFSASEDGTFASTLELVFMPGQNEKMAYYKDASAAAATITATPDTASGLDAEMTDVDTEEISVDSVTFTVNDETGRYAKADDVVTVTAMATRKRMPTPTFSIGTIGADGENDGSLLNARSMTESPDGTYTGTWTVVVGRNGTYSVSVKLSDLDPVAAPTQLTVDTLMPTVTITAPAAATFANGDTVTITATVDDGDQSQSSGISTVTANVSAVDTTQTETITLSMSNGTYSRSFTISAGNEAADGSRAIEVTATDKAGNSGSAIVNVTLDNTPPDIESASVMMDGVVKDVVKKDDMVEVSAMVTGANDVKADVSALNAAAGVNGDGMVTLMEDPDNDDTYIGSFMVTAADPADDGEKTITITAKDDAASVDFEVTVTLDNTAPVITSITSPSEGMNVKTAIR